jgi:aminoglycoside phosphotransferase (APT) family kinase protein
MHADEVDINVSLVRRLIATQFPQWADLPVRPVEVGGWDNRTFHLGAHMTVRLPSAAAYALQEVVAFDYYTFPSSGSRRR